jgi:hypothetical protein
LTGSRNAGIIAVGCPSFFFLLESDVKASDWTRPLSLAGTLAGSQRPPIEPAVWRLSMKTVLVVSLLVLLVGLGPKTCADGRDGEARVLAAIAQRGIPENELTKAIARLRMPANEPSEYWSRIADDPSYHSFHRRRAAVQLFRRHIHAGMRLSEVAHVLNHPTWLRASDIRLVDYLLGGVPVRFYSEDTVFVLGVLSDPRVSDTAVYLRMADKIDARSFKRIILGQAEPNDENATVAEIGFVEPQPR